MFFSRSLREKNEKRGATPRPLNVVDSCHDSAKRASTMALAASRVQRGCKLKVAETADFSCVLVSRDDAMSCLLAARSVINLIYTIGNTRGFFD